jgi:spore photoproduct lyase
MTFRPERVFFEQDALEYPLGQELYRRFRREGLSLTMIGSHNRVTGIPGKTPQEAYWEAKRTLVIGVRRTLKFETCKPSAHYQLPLCTSCIGKCEYCYLNTTLGRKPYLRVYVNLDEILQSAKKYIEERKPEITLFEGAATSDPIPYEAYTGALARSISFFAQEEYGRFRFVTKFTEVDSLLALRHQGHTQIRFSLNTEKIIAEYEHQTPSLAERVAAAVKCAQAGYPLGFLLAPVFIYQDWQRDYANLLEQLAGGLADYPRYSSEPLTFEIITHRFTARAKKNIQEVFPATTLSMEKEKRQFKYGQFGYGKYLYPKEQREEIKALFQQKITEKFPTAQIKYVV